METIIRNTDTLKTGVFVINNDRAAFHTFNYYETLFLTQDGNSSLKKEILHIINKATSVLKICSFIITDNEIFNAILNKAKESQIAIFVLTQLDQDKLKNDLALIDFITEEEIKENPAQTHIKYIRKLYDNGIHVRASTSAHSKFIVSDRNLGFITSANLTTPSLTFNTESGVYLDENSSKQLDKLFDVMFLQGTVFKQFLGTRKKGKMLVVHAATTINDDLLPKPSKSKLRYTCESYENNLLDEIIKLINESNDFIFLSAYSIVGLNSLPNLIQSIKDAKERNVHVSVFCRGMNYRNDHLRGVSELAKLGCKVYADVYNHSKGVINEKTGLIFTANIDGNHGLTNGFEVGFLLNERQRLEFLDFHQKLIETSLYVYDSKPTRNELFQTYIAYEKIKGLNAPSFPQSLIIFYKKNQNIKIEEFYTSIIFYGKSKDDEFLIAGNSYFKCRLKDDTFSILESIKPRYDIEKYVLKFFELKISEKQ
jgi:phosphatidylserine/phosphatidylglycerophosphate/cardiolipin synthase-like enzyme